ncbi:MAG: endolytic transglycosylase MltG [Bacteroidales bacterium]|nr:endolytic transglycosylase MltG [Bacteroidales bacterium]MDY4706388.1 endolytic transglycosylase MltG [Prevotella sp.]MCI7653746.1 endolytic transglycosylase MltG [Bacteroidales bacterium]MDD7706336.1 endolytic transglycosylase MltG [Bacteroidales bacterium]MDY4952458.1 endolytic transglycosylase MltG [Prevotella sp.]
MNTQSKRRSLVAAAIVVVAMLAFGYYYFFSSFAKNSESQFVYIDNDDDVDSVLAKLRPMASEHGMNALGSLVRHFNYGDHIRTGRYEVGDGIGALQLFRHLRNGLQTPVKLTIPSVRTMDRLAGELSKKLMMDSVELYKMISDESVCRAYGLDTATMVCLFIPNTYDIYWNITPEKLLKRMKKEYDTFWNDSRKAKAKAEGLTPVEVMTLASIVDEETANNGEKPMIAGMYLNRLKFRDAEYPEGMPLQADPTIKFAWKRFDLKRIYNSLLYIRSPYNTYKNPGLPPGPIRIPSVEGIEAVLNAVHHNYLYMCAKEDFSGTHNFARTYEEHQRNAVRYSEALNKRGIK